MLCLTGLKSLSLDYCKYNAQTETILCCQLQQNTEDKLQVRNTIICSSEIHACVTPNLTSMCVVSICYRHPENQLIKGKVYASHRYENSCIHFQTQMHNITHKHIYFTKAECLQPLAVVTRVGKCYCQSCISLQLLCHACTLQLTAAVLFLPGQQDMGWQGEKEKVNFSLPGVRSWVPLILQKVRGKMHAVLQEEPLYINKCTFLSQQHPCLNSVNKTSTRSNTDTTAALM